jgi:hypothetical protein
MHQKGVKIKYYNTKTAKVLQNVYKHTRYAFQTYYASRMFLDTLRAMMTQQCIGCFITFSLHMKDSRAGRKTVHSIHI